MSINFTILIKTSAANHASSGSLTNSEHHDNDLHLSLQDECNKRQESATISPENMRNILFEKQKSIREEVILSPKVNKNIIEISTIPNAVTETTNKTPNKLKEESQFSHPKKILLTPTIYLCQK